MGDEFLREAGAVCQGDRDIVYEDAPPADSVTVYKLLNVFYETAFSSPCVSRNYERVLGLECDRGKMFRFPGFVGSW